MLNSELWSWWGDFATFRLEPDRYAFLGADADIRE